MINERHVKIFRSGRDQVICIPLGFELLGEDAIMRKEGDKLIIKSVPTKSLLAVLRGLSPIEEDFPPVYDAPMTSD